MIELFSGFIGAILGAGVSLLATWWANKHISKERLKDREHETRLALVPKMFDALNFAKGAVGELNRLRLVYGDVKSINHSEDEHLRADSRWNDFVDLKNKVDAHFHEISYYLPSDVRGKFDDFSRLVSNRISGQRGGMNVPPDISAQDDKQFVELRILIDSVAEDFTNRYNFYVTVN